PKIFTDPISGVNSPKIILIRVLFPAPLRPKKPKTEAFGIFRLIFSKTVLFSYLKVTSDILIAVILIQFLTEFVFYCPKLTNNGIRWYTVKNDVYWMAILQREFFGGHMKYWNCWPKRRTGLLSLPSSFQDYLVFFSFLIS